MSWVAAGVASAAATAQLVKAHQQKKAAKKIKVGKEEVSQESTKALSSLKARSKQGFAGKEAYEEKSAAARANVLKATDPRNRNAMLAESMKRESDDALAMEVKDAEAKESNTSEYLDALERMGQKKEGIQQREVDTAARAKQALLSASDQNQANAFQSAAGAASVAGAGAGGGGSTGGTPKSGLAGSAGSTGSTAPTPGTGSNKSGTDISIVTQKEFTAMSPEDQAAYKAKYGTKYI